MPLGDANVLRQIRALTLASLFTGVQVVGVCLSCILKLALYI